MTAHPQAPTSAAPEGGAVSWPPGLPVFGLLTPFPATPLYQRLETTGRLTRPRPQGNRRGTLLHC